MANLPFIIASAHVEYKAPITKTDEIEIAMTVPRIGGKSWDFDYEVRHTRTKVVFATLKTVQVAYDYAKKATREIPIPLRALLAALSP